MVSERDVAFYQEHGWYFAGTIIPTELLDRARQAIDDLHAGRRDHELPSIVDRAASHDEVRLSNYVSLQMNAVAELVRLPVIGRIAATLTGSPSIRLFRDSVFFKPPSSRPTSTVVGWHTDAAYWQTCTAKNMLTAWIPLHDVDDAVGPLVLLDRSHRWPDNSHLRSSEERDLPAIEARFRSAGAPVVEVPARLRKGEVSFHDCRTVHGSRQNTGRTPRVAVTVHMQTAENRYQRAYDESGRQLHHMNDFVCRRTAEGLPDYSDPDVFPLLWPR